MWWIPRRPNREPIQLATPLLPPVADATLAPLLEDHPPTDDAPPIDDITPDVRTTLADDPPSVIQRNNYDYGTLYPLVLILTSMMALKKQKLKLFSMIPMV